MTLTDGRMLTERVEDVRGTADNPMTRDEVVAKARELMTPVLGAARQKLTERIFDLERLKSVRDLVYTPATHLAAGSPHRTTCKTRNISANSAPRGRTIPHVRKLGRPV